MSTVPVFTFLKNDTPDPRTILLEKSDGTPYSLTDGSTVALVYWNMYKPNALSAKISMRQILAVAGGTVTLQYQGGDFNTPGLYNNDLIVHNVSAGVTTTFPNAFWIVVDDHP